MRQLVTALRLKGQMIFNFSRFCSNFTFLVRYGEWVLLECCRLNSQTVWVYPYPQHKTVFSESTFTALWNFYLNGHAGSEWGIIHLPSPCIPKGYNAFTSASTQNDKNSYFYWIPRRQSEPILKSNRCSIQCLCIYLVTVARKSMCFLGWIFLLKRLTEFVFDEEHWEFIRHCINLSIRW